MTKIYKNKVFEKIKSINLQNKASWEDKIFLTFDIDWAPDEILSYTLDIVEKYDIKATFFCTHETILLERMKENPNIELGIHPNFNFLLQGDFRYGKTYQQVIDYYMNIIPDAVSVRSHSMTQNSNILKAFADTGLQYDCNHFIPLEANVKLKPWLHWDKKLIKVPYFWEDDAHFIFEDDWNIKKFISYEGIKIFDFHPIHIFLNTENIERYNRNKDNIQNINISFININNSTKGTRSFFFELINSVK